MFYAYVLYKNDSGANIALAEVAHLSTTEVVETLLERVVNMNNHVIATGLLKQSPEGYKLIYNYDYKKEQYGNRASVLKLLERTR